VKNSEQEEAWLYEAYTQLAKELDLKLTMIPFPNKPGFEMELDYPECMEDIVEARMQQIVEQINTK